MGLYFHIMNAGGDDWKVVREDSSEPVGFHNDKPNAVAHARQLAMEQGGSTIIVHKCDGTIESAYRYGQDPLRRVA